ncbi:transglycosylase domain-containing protein [Croceimicrobium hydrocarbonivorans]|uniref:Transglycosylase domain-containing protein n=1 Tax=Croceimicrobium hydrocarbonivorans TaxID=2761580 RepID=A0A7H0VJR7_9FLAO|nr:transglycosylase domain-containing protein [Croceimicrobium hydrocarbonivorans]QNR25965.1 transglycosylase domain-containing protein [Croceimicrobium hydrocarbonivorans]
MAKRKTKTQRTAKNDYRKLVRLMWILYFLGILSIVIVVSLTTLGAFGKLPTFEEIENPKSNVATEIFSSDGETLGKFFKDNRTHIEYSELSPHLINALVATEDERYYSHSGIDFEALARAIVRMGQNGGGSTVTQQLAKQLFHDPPSSVVERILQKFQEWVIAVQLERQYTKEEIVAMYLNQVDFVYDAVGIKSAASTYFNKTPDSLNLQEAALFIGMLQNPWQINPRREQTAPRALQRRNVVFGQMLRNEMITESEMDSLSALPIELEFNRQGHISGTATYFREYLRQYMARWIKEHPKPDGSEYNLYTDGLKIYTTLDSRMQKYAEEAVTEHMSNLQRVFFKMEENRKLAPFHYLTAGEVEDLLGKAMRQTPRFRRMKKQDISMDSIMKVFHTPIEMSVFAWGGDVDTLMSPWDSIRYYKHFYQSGLMSVEPQTGFIKAWVGGIDFRHFQYDHVRQGKRQVGSLFKPFVYTTAIRQKGYSPCFEVPNVRTCIEKGKYDLLKDWCPKNSDDKYGGIYTLKYALANSVNTVTTYLMKQVGPVPVIRMMHEMGIEDEIPTQPSIALGTVDLSVHDIVGAYTTFANKGVYTEPIFITRIEDRNGVVLQEISPRTNEVMSEQDAYVVLDLLKGVTASGTGARLRSAWGSYSNDVVTGFPWNFTNPIAGKTGTTQFNADGWFMGMVPNLITGVWGGCEDRSAHFGSTYYGQGATVSLPVWALFMQKCYADPSLQVSKADFEKPIDPLSIELNCERYKAALGSIDTANVDNGMGHDQFNPD